jgi:hypothetical protein
MKTANQLHCQREQPHKFSFVNVFAVTLNLLAVLATRVGFSSGLPLLRTT